MPAASYREVPDGHSSRKQKSKRRRAKRSPSFVSGRVIGHCDISPRCIPECSAMALHRAVPAARPSRASTLSFVLLAGAFSKSCLRHRFFCGEGGSYLVRGESRRSSMARSSRMRSRATGSGNIPPRCVPGRSTMAKCSRNAFPSVRQWQDCALMRSWPDWQRQYSRAMRSRASIRGKIPPRCVLGRQSVASFALHASQKWPRTGKSPVRGKIRAPCIRKAPQTAVGGYTARISCQEGALFAARAPQIMHSAQILPSAVAPNRPSARNPGAAEQCEPPELDRPTQETQPRRQRPRRLLGSKYRQQPPRYRHRSLPTPASSLSPRRTTLSSPTAPPVETTSTPPPPRRFAELRSPKGRATFPTCGACLLCSWQMRSVCKRQTEPLLRDYFVMVA